MAEEVGEEMEYPADDRWNFVKPLYVGPDVLYRWLVFNNDQMLNDMLLTLGEFARTSGSRTETHGPTQRSSNRRRGRGRSRKNGSARY